LGEENPILSIVSSGGLAHGVGAGDHPAGFIA
jgi:hypothetical protein